MNTEPPFDSRGLPADPLDLLTADERKRLHDDLAEMARRRRRAEAESAHLWIGG